MSTEFTKPVWGFQLRSKYFQARAAAILSAFWVNRGKEVVGEVVAGFSGVAVGCGGVGFGFGGYGVFIGAVSFCRVCVGGVGL